MSTTGVTVWRFAEDFDAARAFYAEALGIEPSDEGPNWVAFHMGGSRLGIHRMGSEPEGQLGPFQDFVVDDLDAALERFKAAGAEILQGVADEAWGRTVAVKTPDGVPHLLIQYGV